MEWVDIRLGDACTKIGSGATPRGGGSVYLDEGPIAFIRSQNVYNEGFSKDGMVYLDEKLAQGLANVQVVELDVLLNITGDSVARACQVKKEVLPARVNQHVAIIRTDQEKLWPTYLRYFLVSPAMQAHMLGLAAVGATRNALTKGMIESFSIRCPKKIDDQKAIAKILSSLDDKIDLNRRINQTLEAMAQAIFKSWFVDFDPVKAKIAAIEQGQDPLRAAMRAISGKTDAELDQMPREHHDQLAATAALFPDAMEESELGEIPKRWEAGKLEDLLVLQRGFDLPSASREPGPYPIIAASGPAGTHSKPMAKGPGVVTGRSGVLGKVFLELNDFWPLNTTLWVKELRAATPCYAYEALKLLDFASFNAGSAVPTLNRNHIHSLPHLVPNKGCVAAYEAFAIALHRQVRSNQEQLEILTRTRDTLLPKLLSGGLSVPNLEPMRQ
ncbi:restriction endonuclease subunit S [Kerstersia gyiorum]|nr:restriction endonuclease subunit S [Kerstersia gyiorum]